MNLIFSNVLHRHVEPTHPSSIEKDQQLIKWHSPISSRRITCASTTGAGICIGSPMYYAVCSIGGSLCCATTHLAILPLDLIKCRMQVNSVKYPSLIDTLKISLKEDGVKGLIRGWEATALGYGAQGVVRFGLYEYLKIKFADWSNPETFYVYRTFMYLTAAAIAEMTADIPLSPFESIKIRTQTISGFPTSLRQAVSTVMATEGIGGFYKSLIPLWGRQIPYTMVKFATFERTLEFLYKSVVMRPRDSLRKSQQLAVTFAAGYTAGVYCAIVSHPADTIISKLQEPGMTVANVYRKIGFIGLWKGLGPRILMIGSVAASQWLIYDAVKVGFNIPRPPPPELPASLRVKLAYS